MWALARLGKPVPRLLSTAEGPLAEAAASRSLVPSWLAKALWAYDLQVRLAAGRPHLQPLFAAVLLTFLAADL